MKGGWKDQRHVSWISSFERHVFPLIGARAVTAIDGAVVLTVLEPIWLSVPDTAKRVLQRIGTVLDFAHIKGFVPDEVSLRSVTRGLPRQTHQVMAERGHCRALEAVPGGGTRWWRPEMDVGILQTATGH